MSAYAPLDLAPAGTGQNRNQDLEDAELASLSLIAHLRIADASARLAGLRNRGEALTDEELAAALEMEEAELLMESISVASIARLQTAGGRGGPLGQRDGHVSQERAVPRLGGPAEHRLPPAEAIARAPTNPSVLCVVCMNDIDGHVIRAPCGHAWDVPCLSELFDSATKDESLFPPMCCGRPLPIDEVREHMDDELVTLFLEKKQEYETRDRVYCSVPTCSVFLGPAADTPSRLFCHVCQEQTTCAHCRGPVHDRSVRCASPDDAALVALAEQEGWRRCERCGHMVELALGCNHMTCRCRFEFCYVCGAPWKTCDCPRWHEERLQAAVEDAAQWRPLGHGDIVRHEDEDEEEGEGDWDEEDVGGLRPEDDGAAALEAAGIPHHAPAALDLDPAQTVPRQPLALPPATRGNWQVGHTASGFLAIVPVGVEHVAEVWAERLRVQANCMHDGDWLHVRVQDQHPNGPLVHPCWRCGRSNVEVGVCVRCLTSRCVQCRLGLMF